MISVSIPTPIKLQLEPLFQVLDYHVLCELYRTGRMFVKFGVLFTQSQQNMEFIKTKSQCQEILHGLSYVSQKYQLYRSFWIQIGSFSSLYTPSFCRLFQQVICRNDLLELTSPTDQFSSLSMEIQGKWIFLMLQVFFEVKLCFNHGG